MNKANFLLSVIMSSLLLGCQSAPPKPDSQMATFQGAGGGSQKEVIPSTQPITFVQLTDCASNVPRLEKGYQNLQLEITKLNLRKTQLAKQNVAIERERDKIDVTDSVKMHDFSQRVGRLHAANVALSKDVGRYNAAVSAQEALRNQHNLSCNNKHYLQSDKARLPQEQQDILESHSKLFDLPVQADASSE